MRKVTGYRLQVTVQGFTLIELLVAMTIVAILSIIGLSTYLGVQSRVRDSQRLDDAKKIITALEQYKSGVGKYPPGTAYITKSTDTPSIWITGLDASNFIGNVLPSDPKNSTTGYNYYYWSSADLYDYCLQVSQENNATGHPYSKGCWINENGDACTTTTSIWRLRFGPQGPSSGICNNGTYSP